MKKITLTGILLSIFSVVTFAQLSLVQLGVKSGINLSTLKGESVNAADYRTSFHFGALAHISVNNKFALQPEVMYAAQGAEYTQNRRDKLSYTNVPVLGQYMLTKGLRLQTGPQVGILMNAKEKNGNHQSDLDNSFKKADFGWTLGTSYLTRSGLGFDARYNHGLTNISKINNDIKNRSWQIGLFYQFS